jgi:hypothetical protein
LGKNDKTKRFGFDLDNTIIDYSHSAIRYSELNSLKSISSVRELKTLLNQADASTIEWNRAQGWIYTVGLEFARLSTGILEFIYWLRQSEYELSIHSHKSKKTPRSSGELDLHSPMVKWLQESKLINYVDFNSALHFYETQDLKIIGLQNARIEYFVDDLVDIFRNPKYPSDVKSFLIPPSPEQPTWVYGVHSFEEIKELLINES